MKQLKITVDGKVYDVQVEVVGESVASAPAQAPVSQSVVTPKIAPKAPTPVAVAGGGDVTSPMAGSIFKLLVKDGDAVQAGQTIVVLEAMKMESPINAPVAGTVSGVQIKAGDAVQEGQLLLKIS